MLRLFLNIPIPAHVILLVFVIILRLPSLIGGFYVHDESLYMLCAQRLLEGGDMYIDAWYAGPPLIIGIYYGFLSLFGSGALFAIRLFACLYVYISAVYFNGMLLEYKPYKRFSFLPAFIFVFLISTPWYIQTFTPTLFILLPVLISFHAIIKLDTGRTRAYSLMFNSGMLMALCILASYKAVFIFGGLILTYLILKSPSLDQLTSLIGGVVVVIGAFILYLFMNDSLDEFWDLGIMYYLDRIGFGAQEMYTYHLDQVLIIWLISWGLLIGLALYSYFHFRMRFYSYVVKIRSLESTMHMWLLVVAITLIFKFRRLEIQDFFLLMPPAVFYANKAFDFKLTYKLRMAILIICMIVPTYIYLSYWGLSSPKGSGMLRPLATDVFLHGGHWKDFNDEDPLISYFEDKKPSKGIWIMDDQPELYMRLGEECANKYIDYRIVANKFSSLPTFSGENIYSNPESEDQIFKEFTLHPPEYIIDPSENFPYLQNRFPSLLGKYTGEKIGKYIVYKTEVKRKSAF